MTAFSISELWHMAFVQCKSNLAVFGCCTVAVIYLPFWFYIIESAHSLGEMFNNGICEWLKHSFELVNLAVLRSIHTYSRREKKTKKKYVKCILAYTVHVSSDVF